MGLAATFWLAIAGPTLAEEALSDPVAVEGARWAIKEYFDPNNDLWRQLNEGMAPVQYRDGYVRLDNGALSGSPGCGRFSGNYRRSGDRFRFNARWRSQRRCSAHQRATAEKMVRALNGDRLVSVHLRFGRPYMSVTVPSDGTMSTGAGTRRLGLELERPGQDFSEIADVWWRTVKVNGSAAKPSVVKLDAGEARIFTDDCRADYALAPLAPGVAGRVLSRPPFGGYGPACPATPKPSAPQPGFPCFMEVFLCAVDWTPSPGVLAFERALGSLTAYRRFGDRLVGVDATGRRVIELEELSSPLERRPWRIFAYEAVDKLRIADVGQAATVTFVHGTLEGSSGCGALSGSYKTSGVNLTLGAYSTLAGWCPEYDKAQVKPLIDAMSQVERFQRHGKRMLLIGRDGRTKIVLASINDTLGSPGPMPRLTVDASGPTPE